MPTPTQLRSGVASLATLAHADLDTLWRQVSDAETAREMLKDILPALVETYGLAAGTFAADWYDERRDEVDAKGRFRAIVPDLGDSGTEALAGWGVAPLFQAEPDWVAARTLISGGLQRRIANMSRQTITTSSVADPQARGWQRVGGGGCDFCAMLIGRGAVYTEATADFESHDHCNCAAVPAF
jgi:hypothetical protein